MAYKCALCGQISFKTFNDYQDHRALFHGLKTLAEPIRTVMPLANSARTRKDVIDEVERRLKITSLQPLVAKPFLSPEPLPVAKIEEPTAHNAECQCQECFITKFQSLIDSVILDLDIITKTLTLK